MAWLGVRKRLQLSRDERKGGIPGGALITVTLGVIDHGLCQAAGSLQLEVRGLGPFGQLCARR